MVCTVLFSKYFANTICKKSVKLNPSFKTIHLITRELSHGIELASEKPMSSLG